MKFSSFLHMLNFVLLAFYVFLNIFLDISLNFLATNSFSWLTQASFAVQDVLYLLDYDFCIRLALISFCCLNYRFFLQHKLFHHPFLILSGFSVSLSNFFEFHLIMLFLLSLGFSWWLLLPLLSSSVLSIIYPWAIWHSCCHL